MKLFTHFFIWDEYDDNGDQLFLTQGDYDECVIPHPQSRHCIDGSWYSVEKVSVHKTHKYTYQEIFLKRIKQ
jgi:hypothetical protein